MTKYKIYFPIIIIITFASCTSLPKRNPLPAELRDKAQISGIPFSKVWADYPQNDYTEQWFSKSRDELISEYPATFGKAHNYLALSGGGDKGAFGSGLLAGWSKSGNRPEFAIVTGISTGALIAPFAFLGKEYDNRLKEIYTSYSTKDLIEERNILRAIFSDAKASTRPLRQLIKKYYNEDIVNKISEEHTKGRRLLIATTNLDAQRPVIWRVSAIAASSYPRKVELIQKIILASASIPVAFEPVLIKVEANGKMYDELHVDGGATAQVFLYPTSVEWDRVLEKMEIREKPNVYIIRNAYIDPEFKVVKNRLLPIAGRSIDSLIRTQGLGDLYRLYASALRDGLSFNLAYIPKDFDEKPNELFDKQYMIKLYKLGYEIGQRDNSWHNKPPGFEH